MANRGKILVCVTQQKTCERLIRKAASIGDEQNSELHIIHVSKKGWKILNNRKEGEALEYLFGISKSVGANLVVLKSDNIPGAIADYAKNNGIDFIILGKSPSDKDEDAFKNTLVKLLPNAEFLVIP